MVIYFLVDQEQFRSGPEPVQVVYGVLTFSEKLECIAQSIDNFKKRGLQFDVKFTKFTQNCNPPISPSEFSDNLSKYSCV